MVGLDKVFFRSNSTEELPDSFDMIINTVIGRGAVRIDPIKDHIRLKDPPGLLHHMGQEAYWLAVNSNRILL
jgi:hypothetical protein